MKWVWDKKRLVGQEIRGTWRKREMEEVELAVSKESGEERRN